MITALKADTNMIFKQLFDSESSTYSYLLADEQTEEALVIDSVLDGSEELLSLLDQLGLRLAIAFDTHTHADHITGMGSLREKTGCITMMGHQSQAHCLSKTFTHGEQINLGSIQLEVIYSPGHTDDSYSFYLASEGMLFSGDTLLIGGTGRTDFQNGDPGIQYDSLHRRILTLPDNTLLYPGHDYKGQSNSTLGAEKISNPRLQMPDRQAYKELMNSLALLNPKLMDIAVSANQACGKLAT